MSDGWLINKAIYLIGVLKGKCSLSSLPNYCIADDLKDVNKYIDDLKEIMDDLEINYVIVKKEEK